MSILPRMVEVDAEASVVKRDEIRCFSDGRCYRYSRWDDWGRWVALAVIVVAILIVAFLFSCINNRRRRRRGMAPMYGTGWVPGVGYKQNGQQQNYYGNQQPYYGGAAPPYTSQPVNNQPTGTTFNSNDGYYGQQSYGNNPYGGQQSGIELQQPQHSYQPGGTNVYPPKGDGVVR